MSLKSSKHELGFGQKTDKKTLSMVKLALVLPSPSPNTHYISQADDLSLLPKQRMWFLNSAPEFLSCFSRHYTPAFLTRVAVALGTMQN